MNPVNMVFLRRYVGLFQTSNPPRREVYSHTHIICTVSAQPIMISSIIDTWRSSHQYFSGSRAKLEASATIRAGCWTSLRLTTRHLDGDSLSFSAALHLMSRIRSSFQLPERYWKQSLAGLPCGSRVKHGHNGIT